MEYEVTSRRAARVAASSRVRLVPGMHGILPPDVRGATIRIRSRIGDGFAPGRGINHGRVQLKIA
jgi:hypothetical protein